MNDDLPDREYKLEIDPELLEGQETRERTERRTVNVGKYTDMADKLLDEHPEVVSAPGSGSKMGKSGISLALQKLRTKDLNRFQGHGITRGSKRDQLAAALAILSEGVMTGDSAELDSEIYQPYRNGTFMVISKRDKDFLRMNGDEFEVVDVQFKNGNTASAVAIEPGALICNDEMLGMVDDLRELFPDIPILRPSDLVNYLQDPPPPPPDSWLK